MAYEKPPNEHHDSTHVGHMHRRFVYSYPTSVSQRIYSLVIVPLAVLFVVFFILRFFGGHSAQVSSVTVPILIAAMAASFARLLIAFAIAFVLSIPIAILITRNRITERILLPIFDVMQSVPVLAFFPVIIIVFVRYQLLNEAAIFILFVTMIWSIVFPLVGGLHTIPDDIKNMARVFKIKGWDYLKNVLLPAMVPFLVVGSLLAWAQAWNIIIVAEVLETYIPNGNAGQNLFGIGSMLVNASASSQSLTFFYALVTLIVTIIIMNFFVWQKLLRYAERFKFD
jgi:NitT/TauT family transport system permease protein